MLFDELGHNPNYDDSDLAYGDSAGFQPDEREQPSGPDPKQEHAACFPYLMSGLRPWDLDEAILPWTVFDQVVEIIHEDNPQLAEKVKRASPQELAHLAAIWQPTGNWYVFSEDPPIALSEGLAYVLSLSHTVHVMDTILDLYRLPEVAQALQADPDLEHLHFWYIRPAGPAEALVSMAKDRDLPPVAGRQIILANVPYDRNGVFRIYAGREKFWRHRRLYLPSEY